GLVASGACSSTVAFPLMLLAAFAQLIVPGTWSRVNKSTPGWLPPTLGFPSTALNTSTQPWTSPGLDRLACAVPVPTSFEPQAAIACCIVMLPETLDVVHFGTALGLNRMFLSKNSRARVVFVPETL